MPKENPTDQDIKQQPINAPRWDDTPPVRLIDWVFEVPEVAAKEERSVLYVRERRFERQIARQMFAQRRPVRRSVERRK